MKGNFQTELIKSSSFLSWKKTHTVCWTQLVLELSLPLFFSVGNPLFVNIPIWAVLGYFLLDCVSTVVLGRWLNINEDLNHDQWSHDYFILVAKIEWSWGYPSGPGMKWNWASARGAYRTARTRWVDARVWADTWEEKWKTDKARRPSRPSLVSQDDDGPRAPS